MGTMCQFNPRCPTKRHNPGTVCRYATGRTYGSALPPAWGSSAAGSRPSSPARTRPAGSGVGGPAGPRRYRRAAASTGISLSDLFIVIVVAAATNRYYAATGWVGVVLAVLAVVIPFSLATWLTWTCTAWNGSKEGRCGNPRHGWRRCEIEGHGRWQQVVTAPEIAAAISILVGLANAAIVFGLAF